MIKKIYLFLVICFIFSFDSFGQMKAKETIQLISRINQNQSSYKQSQLPSNLGNYIERDIEKKTSSIIYSDGKERYYPASGIGFQGMYVNGKIDYVNIYPKECKLKIDGIVKPKLTVNQIEIDSTSEISYYDKKKILTIKKTVTDNAIPNFNPCECTILICYDISMDGVNIPNFNFAVEKVIYMEQMKKRFLLNTERYLNNVLPTIKSLEVERVVIYTRGNTIPTVMEFRDN